MYSSSRGNLFKLAKVPLFLSMKITYLQIMLLIYGIRCLTIFLWQLYLELKKTLVV